MDILGQAAAWALYGSVFSRTQPDGSRNAFPSRFTPNGAEERSGGVASTFAASRFRLAEHAKGPRNGQFGGRTSLSCFRLATARPVSVCENFGNVFG